LFMFSIASVTPRFSRWPFGALLVRHAAALAADRDDRLHALASHHVDMSAQIFLELVVHLGVDDAILKRDRARTGEQGLEAVLAQRRPVGGIDEVEAVDTEPRGLATHVVERELRVRAEIHAPQPLLDAPLAHDLRLRRRLSLLAERRRAEHGPRRRREHAECVSSIHRITPLPTPLILCRQPKLAKSAR
jgi:hypothetical protein